MGSTQLRRYRQCLKASIFFKIASIEQLRGNSDKQIAKCETKKRVGYGQRWLQLVRDQRATIKYVTYPPTRNLQFEAQT